MTRVKGAKFLRPATAFMVLRQAVRHALQAGRPFSSSAPRCVIRPSRIGKEPVEYPPTVTFAQTPTALAVKGPLGTTDVPLHPFMSIAFTEGNTLALTVEDASERKQRSLWQDRKLFLIWLPAVLLALAYFLVRRAKLIMQSTGLTTHSTPLRFCPPG